MATDSTRTSTTVPMSPTDLLEAIMAYGAAQWDMGATFGHLMADRAKERAKADAAILAMVELILGGQPEKARALVAAYRIECAETSGRVAEIMAKAMG